jgi:hypothetical protein
MWRIELPNSCLPTSLSLNHKGSTYQSALHPWGDPSLFPCGPASSREIDSRAASHKASHKRFFEEDRFTTQVNIEETTVGRQHITQNVPNRIGFQKKVWKPNKRIQRMVLGMDIGLEETCRLALYGLVGILSYSYLANSAIVAWMEKTWKPFLGYVPEVIYLTKGWMGFICKSFEDASLLLSRFWVLGSNILMLKRWRVDFNPQTEYFHHRYL